MKFKEALEIANAGNRKILVPIKMGFFVVIRNAQKPTTKQSYSKALATEFGLENYSRRFEANVVEINYQGAKLMKEIQDDWLGWEVTREDLERDTYLVV